MEIEILKVSVLNYSGLKGQFHKIVDHRFLLILTYLGSLFICFLANVFNTHARNSKVSLAPHRGSAVKRQFHIIVITVFVHD